MVYSDLSDISNSKIKSVPIPISRPNDFPIYFKASVIDRVFSFLLDYLIMSPVISFFLLTLFQAEVTAWKNPVNQAENTPGIILLGFAFVGLFSLLQSFFIYFWKATPGQHFLKLEIKMDARPKMFFLRIWLRQSSFWLSVIFLGLPWLAVLAHPNQRTFYDRLSESNVYSLKAKQKYFSFEVESAYWRSLMATFALFFVAILFGMGWQQHSQIKMAAYTFAHSSGKNFCQELKSVELKDRLQTAIAMNLVGQLSDECTDKEAEFTLWTMQDEELRSLAYYAKSLTTHDETDEENYLQQACAEKGTNYLGCQIATAFSTDDLMPFYKTLKSHSGQTLLTATLRYELGQTLNQVQESKANFKNLKEHDRLRIVKKYLLDEVVTKRLADLPQTNQRSPASVGSKKRSRQPSSDEGIKDDLDYAQQLIDRL